MSLLSGLSRPRGPAFAPIPRRYRPLRWRQPILLWLPAALVLGLGWPALALREEPGLMQAALIAGGAGLLISLITLGVSYGIGLAPRSRAAALGHVLAAGVTTALAAPFGFSMLLDYLARSERNLIGASLTDSAAWAAAPLALMLGLPAALLAGFALVIVALEKPRVQSWAEAVAPAKPNLPIVVTGNAAPELEPRRRRTPQLTNESGAA